ncbi:MAG: hypothetical protein MnENMB40S_26820 [Rhizobiaceae bacterium MnEN-MB40S]|nr:MAG: hypothetical protein MnENMB40S_26820 [Rhizobiaceae bacterium MnEN-MB40S]
MGEHGGDGGVEILVFLTQLCSPEPQFRLFLIRHANYPEISLPFRTTRACLILGSDNAEVLYHFVRERKIFKKESYPRS